MLMLIMLISRNRTCEPDNKSLSISITKQQYLVSAKIQVKIVPNHAITSSFQMASSSSSILDFYEKLAEAVYTHPCLYAVLFFHLMSTLRIRSATLQNSMFESLSWRQKLKSVALLYDCKCFFVFFLVRHFETTTRVIPPGK